MQSCDSCDLQSSVYRYLALNEYTLSSRHICVVEPVTRRQKFSVGILFESYISIAVLAASNKPLYNSDREFPYAPQIRAFSPQDLEPNTCKLPFFYIPKNNSCKQSHIQSKRSQNPFLPNLGNNSANLLNNNDAAPLLRSTPSSSRSLQDMDSKRHGRLAAGARVAPCGRST